MHDDAGVDDRRRAPSHSVGRGHERIGDECEHREKRYDADASLGQRRGRPSPERVPGNGLLGRDRTGADADDRGVRGDDRTGGQETGSETAQTHAGDDRGGRAER